MLVEHRGAVPQIDPSAWIAPTATLVGDVHVGADSRVLWNAVISAEDATVRIGRRCVVMEHGLIRGRDRYPVTIGDDVLIGPHAHVNGATIGTGAFVATGAGLFPGARMGERATLMIHAVLHARSILPAGARVPIGWVAVGEPDAELFPPSEASAISAELGAVDFFGTTYGVPREPADERMRQQAEWFGAHVQDRVLPDSPDASG